MLSITFIHTQFCHQMSLPWVATPMIPCNPSRSLLLLTLVLFSSEKTTMEEVIQSEGTRKLPIYLQHHPVKYRPSANSNVERGRARENERRERKKRAIHTQICHQMSLTWVATPMLPYIPSRALLLLTLTVINSENNNQGRSKSERTRKKGGY